MVAQTAPLPNIRRLFIPDPGHMIAEADLSGADAQVVAWEAGDEDLKNAFRKGMKLHAKNARDVFPSDVGTWTDEQLKATDHPNGIYYNCKRAVHGTNYGAGAPRIAEATNWPVSAAIRFQERWFNLHPGIKEWQNRTDYQLKTTRTIRNKFGYRIIYFDRTDRLLPEALAWIPQSTVANVCIRGGVLIRRTLPWVRILLQVHDSLIFQYPISMHKERWQIGALLNSITVPYDDPLHIPWSFSCSRKSWGDCEGALWEDRVAA